MALPDVIINEGQGGLGRVAPGEDYISGMPFYSDSLPSGFTLLANIKQVLSLAAAETLGILNDYSDETRSTGKIVITNAGATGDSIEIFFTAPNGTVVSLGKYTNISSDTIATFVTGLTAAINSGTPTHGFTAVASLSTTVTWTAKAGYGIFPNTGTPYTKTVVGAAAGTITQNVIAGVASLLAQWHYHISEYFRINPTGNLFVGFFPLAALSAGYTFVELITMQTFAAGKIRQFGLYLPKKWAVGLTDVQFITAVADLLEVQLLILRTNHVPAVAVFSTDISAVSDLSTLPDLGIRNDPKASITVGQDGANAGWNLYKATGKSIGNTGAILGAISLAAVDESILWIQKFNLTNGTELSVPGFGNGQKNTDVSINLLTQLDNYRYIFLRNYGGVAGTYASNSPSIVTAANDYAFIENNRTAHKAERLLYAAYIPLIGSPIRLNADGTLSDTTLAYFTTVGNVALDSMVRDGELSGRQILIDPRQNVLSTNQLAITAEILQNGVARTIVITLTNVTALTA